MVSVNQTRANRANAKQSTGPQSHAGKARSSKNALKHGLSASQIVIGAEDPDQFERLRAGLLADFRPSTTIDRELIDQLAGLLWRLRRVTSLEADLLRPPRQLDFKALTNAELDQLVTLYKKAGCYPEERPPSYGESDPIKDSEKSEMLSKLSRYETGLRNAVTRTLNLLHALRVSRAAVEEEARTVDATPPKGKLSPLQ